MERGKRGAGGICICLLARCLVEIELFRFVCFLFFCFVFDFCNFCSQFSSDFRFSCRAARVFVRSRCRARYQRWRSSDAIGTRYPSTAQQIEQIRTEPNYGKHTLRDRTTATMKSSRCRRVLPPCAAARCLLLYIKHNNVY